MKFWTLRHRWTPTWTIVLVLVVSAGLTTVATRQVTTHLRGDPPPSTVAIDQADQADPAGAAGGPADSTGDAAPLPPAVAPGTVPEAAANLAPGTGSEPIIGEPVIEKVDPQPVPDRVSLQAGTVPDQRAPLPAEAPDDSGEAGPFEAPDPGSNQQAPPARGFGVGIWVEPVGHFARITVGVSGGPDGLAALSVAFGDGQSQDLSASQVAQLRDGGTFTVVHRYEPTLTPQPRQARVIGSDQGGKSRTSFVEFETQAEFRAGFSALTVTALEDCDRIAGKNDFELRWNIDGRTSRSRFDLDQGESYVEQGFRRGVNGVRYGGDYRYYIEVIERDGYENLLDPWTWDGEFWPVHSVNKPVDIASLGAYRVPVTLFYRATGDDECLVRLDYTYTVAMSDTPPHAA